MTQFTPREHLMTIGYGNQKSEYLPVQWRLVWFRQECPEGTIETEMIHLDLDRMTEAETFVYNQEKRRSEKVIKEAPGLVIFRATVTDGKGGRATATKMEKASSFLDFIEKAETGAVGRALAMLGYGTQFTGLELDEGMRIVDSPVQEAPAEERSRPARPSHPSPSASSQPLPPQRKAFLDLLAKAKARAEALGLDWEQEKELVLGSPVPDSALTVQQIALINGDLTRAEKKAS